MIIDFSRFHVTINNKLQTHEIQNVDVFSLVCMCAFLRAEKPMTELALSPVLISLYFGF